MSFFISDKYLYTSKIFISLNIYKYFNLFDYI